MKDNMKNNMKNRLFALIIIITSIIISINAYAKAPARTMVRETIGDHTISVTRQGKRTYVLWDGEVIHSYKFSGKVKIIPEGKFTYKKRISRKGKILYIERCVGVVTSRTLDGKTSTGGYISYRSLQGKVKKGDVIVSYFIYNPHTSWIDDADERYDIIL